MALDKSTLKSSIKAALQNAIGVEDNFDTLAQNIADAIDAYVSAHVHKINSGSSAPGPTGTAE